MVLLVLGGVGCAAYARPRLTATVLVAGGIAFYILIALLKLVITAAGRGYRPPRQFRVRPGDQALPPYAVLLPVHKEANMLGHLVARVDKLVYPRRQLCILLLIEHDDDETLAAARQLGIPFYSGPRQQTPGGHLRVLVVPPGGPKTKPNALNAAMTIVVRERCEYVTVYDAEDRPDHDQLLKAVGTFRAAGPELACLQAELAFWNDNTNWVTALYWIGYKTHFTRFLPGLARLGLPIPLGGTSNHFRVSALLDVALRPGGEVWDPRNLTEDADLGARLAAGGYQVDLLRSITMEEAPVRIGVVDKQQRRWKAGYLQTGLVHTRRPLRAMRRMGALRWLCFNLLIFGVPVTFLLNPLFMAITVAFFTTRAAVIEALFPTAVYYPAVAVMLLGNFIVLYELMHTCVAEAEHSRGRFGLLRYMLIAQLMWLWMSRSTYIAVFELITGRRGWHKTPHGHAEEAAPAPLRARLQYPQPGPQWQQAPRRPEPWHPEPRRPEPRRPEPRRPEPRRPEPSHLLQWQPDTRSAPRQPATHQAAARQAAARQPPARQPAAWQPAPWQPAARDAGERRQ
jgi:cellulose synthase/poly-beta-1,6-N-acetylglucosamine synthase-like glycosyltransferase